MFTVLQLVVYAGMQVPVGVLLDRFGSRALLLTGLGLMTAGQLVRVRRVLPGSGAGAGRARCRRRDDLRQRDPAGGVVVPGPPGAAGDPADRAVGQLGAIIAAAPLSYALQQLGWTRTFALASSIGVVLMVAAALVVKDSPYARTVRRRSSCGR